MKADLTKAIDTLNGGNYTCVLCRDNTLYTSTERGVKPLIEWLDGNIDLKGYSAADKVVGKAAAFLYVLLGVSEVYAHVMSEGAIQVFTKNGIAFQYDISAKNIINRTKTGICPMEQATEKISSPTEALAAVRLKLTQLSKGI